MKCDIKEFLERLIDDRLERKECEWIKGGYNGRGPDEWDELLLLEKALSRLMDEEASNAKD